MSFFLLEQLIFIHNYSFIFSGLLMAYTTLKFLRKTKGRFNFLQFAINMYLRFYPTIFGVILLYYLLPLWDSGPFWHHMDQYFVYACRHQLLSSMLSYNFYDVDLEFLQNHSFVCLINSIEKNSIYFFFFVFICSAIWQLGGQILVSI